MVEKKQKPMSKGRPYHIVTGKITTVKYAADNPTRVKWIDNKKPDKRVSSQ
jgi:hypothetical protein